MTDKKEKKRFYYQEVAIDHTAKEVDFVGEKVMTLYKMLQDETIQITPGDNGGIRFETKFSAMELDETDGLYCEHKSAHADSWDTPGPTPDHPDTTHHGTYCDDCNEWLEPEEPDYDE